MRLWRNKATNATVGEKLHSDGGNKVRRFAKLLCNNIWTGGSEIEIELRYSAELQQSSFISYIGSKLTRLFAMHRSITSWSGMIKINVQMMSCINATASATARLSNCYVSSLMQARWLDSSMMSHAFHMAPAGKLPYHVRLRIHLLPGKQLWCLLSRWRHKMPNLWNTVRVDGLIGYTIKWGRSMTIEWMMYVLSPVQHDTRLEE